MGRMGKALTGILGGVKGGGNAVADIAEDARHDLAEKLKLEMLQSMKMDLQKDQQDFTAGENKLNRQSDVDLANIREKGANKRSADAERGANARTGLMISSRQEIAYDKNELDRELAKLQRDLESSKIDQRSREVASNIIAEIRTNGGTIEDANAQLEINGLDMRFEEYIVNPDAREKDQHKSWRIVGSGPPDNTGKPEKTKPDSTEDKTSTLKALRDRFLGGSNGKSAGGVSSAAENAGTSQAKPASSSAFDPNDPSTWQVVQKGGDLVIITDSGPQVMTPEQIKMWKTSGAGGEMYENMGLLKQVQPGGVERRRARDVRSFSGRPPIQR